MLNDVSLLFLLCQGERYREALYDLKHILRLEPPPTNGAAVSDDMLAVQKMARDCEQKVTGKGISAPVRPSTADANYNWSVCYRWSFCLVVCASCGQKASRRHSRRQRAPSRARPRFPRRRYVTLPLPAPLPPLLPNLVSEVRCCTFMAW